MRTMLTVYAEDEMAERAVMRTLASLVRRRFKIDYDQHFEAVDEEDEANDLGPALAVASGKVQPHVICIEYTHKDWRMRNAARDLFTSFVLDRHSNIAVLVCEKDNTLHIRVPSYPDVIEEAEGKGFVVNLKTCHPNLKADKVVVDRQGRTGVVDGPRCSWCISEGVARCRHLGM